MNLDLSKKMTMDEWRCLHSPDLYYAIYATDSPDLEKIALLAIRKTRRDMERQFRREMTQMQEENDFSFNINSTINIKKIRW